MHIHRPITFGVALLLGLGSPACGGGEAGEGSGSSSGGEPNWTCLLPAGDPPDFSTQLGCQADFDALASLPLDASIPGARSTKTIIDQLDGGNLWFQNSKKYPIHWEFAHEHLSG